MKKHVFWVVIGIMLTSLACGLSSQSAQPTFDGNELSTVVASTLQALTPTTAPPTEAPSTQFVPDGISINFENVSFVIPNGLSNGALGGFIPEVTAENGAPWEAAPSHIKFSLNDYVLPGAMWSPEIKIFPVEDYLLVDPQVGQRMDEIKSIAANPGAPLPENLPFLPFINAGQVFYAQMQTVNFQNGSGIRYVTQFDQAPFPINNQEMFYTYQGLSQDGKYFISATFPISIAFLPADGSPNSPTPTDGVPIDWDNYENFPIYLDAVVQKLMSADPNAFMPSMQMLDSLIQSIEIK